VKPDEIKQLLGGYATGTLTPEEQKALFDAALRDQDLFEALAGEQALKEALDEPSVRRELIAALETRDSWRERARAWLRSPYQWAAAGAIAAAALTVVAIVRYSGPAFEKAPAEQMAQSTEPAALQQPEVAPAPIGLPRKKQPSPPAPPAFEAPKRAFQPASPAVPEPPAALPAAPPQSVPESTLANPAAAPPPPPAPSQMVRDQLQSGAPSIRSSFAAAETAGPAQARDLFYGIPVQTALPGGVAGGAAPAGELQRAAKGKASAAVAASARVNAPAARSLAQPLGLRYSVRAPQGSPPQLVVESNADAVLYIFRRSGAGGWLPVNGGGMSLSAHTSTTSAPIPLDNNVAPPRAVLVLSRAALTELAQTGPELTAAVEKLRAQNESAPLLTQTTSGSTYVVTPRPAAIIVSPLAIP
jgi:hypothetical protein